MLKMTTAYGRGATKWYGGILTKFRLHWKYMLPTHLRNSRQLLENRNQLDHNTLREVLLGWHRIKSGSKRCWSGPTSTHCHVMALLIAVICIPFFHLGTHWFWKISFIIRIQQKCMFEKTCLSPSWCFSSKKDPVQENLNRGLQSLLMKRDV